MLLMKKIFFDAIRSGKKTSTLRFWRRPRVRAGSRHNIRGLGKIHIEAIELIDPEMLTHEDAVNDGFDSLAELKRAMNELYPSDLRRGRKLYRIRFRYLGREG